MSTTSSVLSNLNSGARFVDQQRGKRSVTSLSQTFFAVAVAIDGVQLFALALKREFGWSSRDLQWLHNFSIFDLLLPDADPALFNALFAVTVILVWACVAAAAYVGHMFRTGVYKHIWPMKFLRFFVTIFVTAGFIPTLQIVLAPLVCNQMKRYNGAEFECGSVHAVLFMLMSLSTLSVLLPMGLVAARFSHDSNPNSAALNAKVNGREQFYTMVAKLVLVAATPFAISYPGIVALLYCVLLAALSLYTASTLPYFDRRMNGVRSGITGWAAFLALGGVILSSLDARITASLDVDTFTLLWLLVSPVLAAAAASLPWFKYRSLERTLASLRHRMERDLQAAHASTMNHAMLDSKWLPGPITEVAEDAGVEDSDSDVDAKDAAHPRDTGSRDTGSSRLRGIVKAANAKAKLHQLAATRQRPSNGDGRPPDVLRSLAQTVVTTYYQSMSRILPLGELQGDGSSGTRRSDLDGSVDGSDVSDSSWDEEEAVYEPNPYFGGIEAREVELLVRVLLSRPENRRKTRRRYRSARQVPSTAGLSRAMWLFAEGIQEFADDAVDIGTVKVCWAMYLHTYTGDLNLVLSALEVANRESLGIDGQFEVFTRMRTLQQLRQSRDIGSDGKMNMIALVEYRKRMKEAIRNHVLALRFLSTTFSMGIKVRKALEDDAAGKATETNTEKIDDLTDALGALVNKARDAASKAESIYLRLLREHSNAPQVARAFAQFCTDVLGDPERAAVYSKSSSKPKSSNKSSATPEVTSGASEGSYMTGDISARGLQPKPQAQVVLRMEKLFQFGIIVVLSLVVVMFGLLMSSISDVKVEWDDVHDICSIRTHVLDSAWHARNLHIEGSSLGSDFARIDVERNATLVAMESLRERAESLFRNTRVPLSDEILDMWESRNAVNVSFLLNDGAPETDRLFRDRSMSMWDTLARVQHFGTVVARTELPLLDSLPSSTAWRFLLDNVLLGIVPRLHALSDLYQARFAETLEVYQIQQGIALGLCIVVLACSAIGVFGKAARQVKSIKLSLRDTIEAIPAVVLVSLRGKYKSAHAAARSLAVVVESEEAGNESPRELDDVSLDGSDLERERRGDSSDDGARSEQLRQQQRRARRKNRASESAVLQRGSSFRTKQDKRRLQRTPWSVSFKATEQGDSPRDSEPPTSRSSHDDSTSAGLAEDEEESSASVTGATADATGGEETKEQELGSMVAAVVGIDEPHAETSADEREARPLLPGLLLSPLSKHPQQPALGIDGAMAELATVAAGEAKAEGDAPELSVETAPVVRSPPIAAIVSGMPTAVVVVDSHRNIVFINDRVTQLFGLTGDKLLGLPVDGLYPGGHAPLVADRRSRNSVVPKGTGAAVDVGAATAVDIAQSTPVTMVNGSGDEIEAVQMTSTVEIEGATYTILSITIVAVTQDALVERAEEEGIKEVHKRKCCGPTARAVLGLVVIGALLSASYFITISQFLANARFANEIDEAGRLRSLVHETAFAAQELVIGDAEFRDSDSLIAYLDEKVVQLEDTRHALRFGGIANGVLLEGSANRYGPQDALQFDAVEEVFDGDVYVAADDLAAMHGLDVLLGSYVDELLALVEPYRDSTERPAAAGASRVGLSSNGNLVFLSNMTDGNLDAMLERSVELYVEESRIAIEGVIDIAAVVYCIAAAVLLLVYFGVFRGVARQMLVEARRNERFLELLPPTVTKLPGLARFFVLKDQILH